jgi:hypothetical protein
MRKLMDSSAALRAVMAALPFEAGSYGVIIIKRGGNTNSNASTHNNPAMTAIITARRNTKVR